MITLEEIQQHFDDVTVKDGDMGEYAEIQFFPETYVHVYLSKKNRPELYTNHKLVCSLFGVKTIADLKKLHRLIMS